MGHGIHLRLNKKTNQENEKMNKTELISIVKDAIQ